MAEQSSCHTPSPSTLPKPLSRVRQLHNIPSCSRRSWRRSGYPNKLECKESTMFVHRVWLFILKVQVSSSSMLLLLLLFFFLLYLLYFVNRCAVQGQVRLSLTLWSLCHHSNFHMHRSPVLKLLPVVKCQLHTITPNVLSTFRKLKRL